MISKREKESYREGQAAAALDQADVHCVRPKQAIRKQAEEERRVSKTMLYRFML